nr:Uma2 family endonuclease [Anaerolineae bacterium]
NGDIFAMAGGSYNHNVLSGNFYAALNQFLMNRSCTAFTSDMRLLVESVELYTYPDVMVICGEPQLVPGRTDTVTNPVLIIEVLSKSTQDYDRGLKFEFYRTIDSFQDYVLVDQDRVHLEYYRKQPDGRWLLTEIKAVDAFLTLESIGLSLSIRQIYNKVDWFAG